MFHVSIIAQKATMVASGILFGGMHPRGRKEMFYFPTTDTLHLRLYGDRDMAQDHSDRKRGNPLPSHHGLLFPVSSKDYFIYISPQSG